MPRNHESSHRHPDRTALLDPESQTYGPSDVKLDASIRNAFVRKVFGILSAQLALTCVVGSAFTLSRAWQSWAISNQWVALVAGLAAVGVVLALACVPDLTQRHPANMILLGLFTLLEALSLGPLIAVVSASLGASVVLQAVIITALVVVGLTLVAMQSKYDFTSWVSYVSVAVMVFAGAGLLRLVLPNSRAMDTIYACVGAAIFGAYFIIDMQMMLGQKRVRVGTDDYIMASLNLYMDTIMLFVHILQLLADSRRDD